MPLSPTQRLALRRQCHTVLPGFRMPTPAEEFQALAQWCEARGVEHDQYGQGDLIIGFERRIAELLGKPAAVFMPSGVMAQLIAVRIWSERTGLPRFGMHPTSHLQLHEEEAYQALFQLQGVPVGNRLSPLLATDLAAVKQALACLIVELPIREAGGQLPSWDALTVLKAAARERQLPLHLDGARLWESRAYYDRSHAEIVAGFDSVYVSMYKGIGGIAGAVLAGEADFIAEARLWQRRMGGTLVHQSPFIASAAMRLDTRLGQLDACYQRTLSLAEQLGQVAGLRVNPTVPHCNMFHLYFDAPAEAVLEARDRIAASQGCWVVGHVKAAEVPGWSSTELTVGDTLLALPDEQVRSWFTQLLVG
ncbi:threonine aldolase family protein [Chitinimonas sp.]|uniref:threonine aldolase family protein n=1 Tax=Chitinimonas sp. TaxID=1934313 RepID=UPI002F92D64D